MSDKTKLKIFITSTYNKFPIGIKIYGKKTKISEST